MSKFTQELEQFIAERDKKLGEYWFQKGVERGQFEQRCEWRAKMEEKDKEISELRAELLNLKLDLTAHKCS